jgi:hypothetical protein
MAIEVETPVGLAERWSAYIQHATTHVLITLDFPHPQKPVQLTASAPGFDGWVQPLDAQSDLLYQIVASLNDWLAYRLANRLPIPALPGVATATLEDLEEYESQQVAEQGHLRLATDTPRPMDDVFAEIDAGR